MDEPLSQRLSRSRLNARFSPEMPGALNLSVLKLAVRHVSQLV
jgi:hypothetical protein